MAKRQDAGQPLFKRRCLRCNKPFAPIDRRLNWICPNCRSSNSKVGGRDAAATSIVRAIDPTFDHEE